MQIKKIKGKGIAVTALGAAAAYGALSFLAAAACFNEMIAKEQMAAVYFAIGLGAGLLSGLIGIRALGMKRIWGALSALGILLLVVILSRGGSVVSPAGVWIYPGVGAGVLVALLTGGRKKSGGKHRTGTRRKK